MRHEPIQLLTRQNVSIVLYANVYVKVDSDTFACEKFYYKLDDSFQEIFGKSFKEVVRRDTNQGVAVINIMEQDTIIETFRTSLPVSIWVRRYSFIGYSIAIIIASLVHLSLIQFFELFLGLFLFTGIAFFDFVGIYAHIQYYFRFEKNRKVELYTDRIMIWKNDQIVQQILKNEITKIILCDKLKSDGHNLWPTYADSYYYLVVIGKNQEQIILTCLLNIRLKKKIAAWYGQELEHKYQFFPFPRSL